MSIRADTGGAVLAFVTRLVKGEVLCEVTIFNAKTDKNEKQLVPVDEPVIVFFPNGSCQVLSFSEAHRRGFTSQPDILNFDSVNDTKTIAGKLKFAMNEEAKQEYWLQMEQVVIGACTSRGGYPLDYDKARYSDESILFATGKPAVKAAKAMEKA